jgi:hypothetical protein
MDTHKLERANAVAAVAVRDIKDGFAFDYCYVVTDQYIELASEFPEIDWLPLSLITVLQKWNAAAIANGFPGLLGIRAPLNASAPRLVGLVSSERIRFLLACGGLRAFNEALESRGLYGLAIGVDVRDGGQELHAIQIAVEDWRGHVARLFDVPVVSKRRAAPWQEEQLVEQLEEQLVESRDEF